MSTKEIEQKEAENGTLSIQHILRNGLYSMRKTLNDARKAIDETDQRVECMMESLQLLVDEERRRRGIGTDQEGQGTEV